MSENLNQEGTYSAANILKIFDIQATKNTLLNAEERKIIPTAQRLTRGKSNYRAWSGQDLPLIGQALGYMKRPSTTKVISVFSLKGGTGKTTVAFQLARAMALHNLRVLVIGLDAQESITQTIIKGTSTPSAPSEDIGEGLYNALSENGNLGDYILETDLPTLHYIPETIELSLLDHWLKQQKRKEYILTERIVNPLIQSNKYDIILFDCNPAWSDVVTGALGATDVLLSPLGADINSLKAAKIFVKLIDEFQTEMHHEFENFLIIPTMVETNKLSQQILARYRVQYESLCTASSIRRSVSIHEANAIGKSMMEVRFSSPAYADFVSFHREIGEALSGNQSAIAGSKMQEAQV